MGFSSSWREAFVFFAAYTAVNHAMPLGAFFLLFLAAYTAVNDLASISDQLLFFLAAYTAVN
ncbi:hypothetical protein AO903_26380 [Pseudomonas aeruginosa]|nr:hypothetical protein AO903_26380 [Pseudomonas aeruginosa]